MLCGSSRGKILSQLYLPKTVADFKRLLKKLRDFLSQTPFAGSNHDYPLAISLDADLAKRLKESNQIISEQGSNRFLIVTAQLKTF